MITSIHSSQAMHFFNFRNAEACEVIASKVQYSNAESIIEKFSILMLNRLYCGLNDECFFYVSMGRKALFNNIVSIKTFRISNLVPRSLIDEAEGEIWSCEIIRFFWLARLWANEVSVASCTRYCIFKEWFSTNRRPMLCAQDSGIARGDIASRYKEMYGVM